ncbi:MAG: hypothetical protein SFW67_00525 [Myxococcaceae bacterium]|nr:hypothetical protein [Myxococcaceae bacterium]
MLAFALATCLAQLSPPPLFPADDAPPPPPAPAWSLREAPRPPPEPPATAGQLVGRAFLAPVISFGIGILTVPVGAFAGLILAPSSSLGGGIGAIAGGFAGYVIGSAIASTLFSRDTKALQRAVPWALGAGALSTVGFCLVVFVPAVGLAALPWVVLGAVVLSAAVPLVVEATRPPPADAPQATVTLARFE